MHLIKLSYLSQVASFLLRTTMDVSSLDQPLSDRNCVTYSDAADVTAVGEKSIGSRIQELVDEGNVSTSDGLCALKRKIEPLLNVKSRLIMSYSNNEQIEKLWSGTGYNGNRGEMLRIAFSVMFAYGVDQDKIDEAHSEHFIKKKEAVEAFSPTVIVTEGGKEYKLNLFSLMSKGIRYTKLAQNGVYQHFFTFKK